jgi:hypothetical protein
MIPKLFMFPDGRSKSRFGVPRARRSVMRVSGFLGLGQVVFNIGSVDEETPM